jgi:Mg-chelatase subunit ChlD
VLVVVTKRLYLLFFLLLFASWYVWGATATEDAFYQGNSERYPQPVPVNSVKREAVIAKSQLSQAYRQFSAATKGTANQGVQVRITAVAQGSVIETQAAQLQLITITTVWQNIHAKQKIDKKSLDKKPDRTMGAGGFYAGDAKGDKKANQQVEKDVAYKVPKWGNHLFLLADGIAYSLDIASAQLHNGADPTKGFAMARQGQEQEVQFLFRIPTAAKNLALQFFDNANGHIQIPLAGDIKLAKGSGFPPGLIDSAKFGGLELGVMPVPAGKPAPEVTTTAGWHLLTATLIGKSNLSRGSVANFAEIDADKYIWLEGDGGFVYYPVPAANNATNRLRFTPDYFSTATVSFLVPDKQQHFRLGARAGSEISHLKLSANAPQAPPKPFQIFQDGNVADWQLYAISRTKDGLLVDMGVQGRDPKKGIEIRPYRQVQLTVNKQKLKPDKRRSQALAYGPSDTVVVPPKGIVRFVLLFDTKQDPTTLYIQGLRSETNLVIKGAPAGNPTLLAIAAPAVKRTTVPTSPPQAAAAGSDQQATSRQQSGSQQAKPTKPVALEPFILPNWDMALAVQETEAGDKIENAIDLGKGLMAKGSIGAKSDRDDFYYFDVEGKPQLWAIEVAGPAVAYLAYLDASQKELIKKNNNKKTGEARIVNLLLMPGRHRIKVRGGSKTGEYAVRAIVIGEIQSGNEFEPNDDDSYANRIVIGESIHGLLDETDLDTFRFSLSAQEHLQIVLDTAKNLKGRFFITGDIKLPELVAKQTGESISYAGLFPPGDYIIRVRTKDAISAPEPYQIAVLRKNPFSAAGEAPPELPVAINGPEKVLSVAAYWPQAQRVNGTVQIKNQGQTPLPLDLSVWTSQANWQAQLGMQDIALAPGESKTVPLNILIEPDTAAIEPVTVAVAARDAQGRMQYQSYEMVAACGAPPVKPMDYFSVPTALLGGLNVAWQGLGARFTTDKSKLPRTANELIDGMTPIKGGLNTAGFKQGKPETFTIKLAGSAAVPVAGFALNPLGGCKSEFWARDFEMALSNDGKTYQKVLADSLARLSHEQYFALPKPVQATHARLRVLSNHQVKKPNRLCLGEWKVIAAADTSLQNTGLNIASPELGGHVVWRSFKASDYIVSELLTGSKRNNIAYLFNDLPNEWVIGFQHNRMAKITKLEWEANQKPYKKTLEKVRLAVSQDGPSGPWQPLGEWKLNSQNAISTYSFKTPIWARFIRFTAEVEKSQYIELPKQIRTFEQQSTTKYRSVIGEWGHYDARGPYEWQKRDSTASNTIKTAANHAKTTALPVTFDKVYPGTASLGSKAAWYRVAIPKGSNTLEWQLSGYPSLTVRPLLMTPDEQLVSLRSQKLSAQTSRYVADVEAGKTYLLKIEEPPRSVVFAWDNSGSVSPYAPSIYQAMATYSEQIKPGREYVNLLPFQYKAPSMLLEAWSDQPLSVLKHLNDYDRKDGSSDAELNLKKAVTELEDQDGNRAILIITDAESGQSIGKPDLWEGINRVYPRVFSFELHNGKASNQDKMQDWASVNAGYYSFFRSQADLDVGFDRAICMLRRPAAFELVAKTKYTKPAGPGKIQVNTSRGSTNTAVEIILDASGSMYKKLGTTTRIATAKSVLKDLMQTSLPEGMPVALRIYGHRKPKACDTKLEMPLQPFKPQKGIRIIEKVDPKDRSKTPLGESLTLVAEDLKNATGQKLVILLTDGEESCDGDPEAAIRSLRESGMDIRVNIVGLAIDSAKTNQQFSHWAKIGGGIYFEANDSKELKSALEKALFPKYQLLDNNGDVVLESVADGSPVQVPAGNYQLKVLTTPIRDMGTVTVKEGQTVKVDVKG